MNEINKPLLSDKKLNDIIEQIELSYLHYIEQCNFIDSQLINTKSNQLNYEIENRMNLKANYQQLTAQINQALSNQDNTSNIDESKRKRLNGMREICEKRYNKIINEYNKLYVFIGDEESVMIKEKDTNIPSYKKVVPTECSSSISSGGKLSTRKTKRDSRNRSFYFICCDSHFLISSVFINVLLQQVDEISIIQH